MAQSQLPPFAQATAGALGSIASNTLVYPLDLLSTRRQTQSRARDAKTPPLSVYGSLREIVDKHGIAGLYQGLGSDTLSNTLSNFLFFYFRSFLIERLKAHKSARLPPRPATAKGKGKGKAPAIIISAVEDLAVGAMAGIASRFFTTPLSNVTVRKQTAATPAKKQVPTDAGDKKQPKKQPQKQPGSDSESDDEASYGDEATIGEILRQIVAEKGFVGLWSGFETAVLLSISPALTFYCTNAFTNVLVPTARRAKPTSLEVFLTSALGNSVATVIVFPLILCKTRLQWRSPSGRRMYKSLADVLRKTLKHGGFKGLYMGLDSQLIKGLFSFATTMMVKQRIETLFVLIFLALRRRAGDKLTTSVA